MKRSSNCNEPAFCLAHRTVMACMLLGMFLFPGACARMPEVRERPPLLTAEEWQSKLRARTDFWHSYQGVVRLKVEGERGRYSFKSTLFADLPDRFRLEALSPLGQAVALLVVNDSDTRLWVPADKMVYASSRPELLMRRMMGVAIPFQTLPYLMAGCVPSTHLSQLQFKPDESGWLGIASQETDGSIHTYHFLSQPLGLDRVTIKSGLTQFEVVFAPPVELTPAAHPTHIAITGLDSSLDVSFDTIDKTIDFPQTVFSPTFPPGVDIVDLDRNQ